MPDSHRAEAVEPAEPPMSISHFVRTLRAYAPVIFISMTAVALVYIVIAVAVYALSPTQRLTSQRFRLDFEGANDARYPNGAKFSSSDIASNAILLRVYQENHLERFTKFPDFSRAVFVLEANPEYERLAADYQARLADPKLSAIDRERIQREWQSKAASLAKSDYSLNWLRTQDTAGVPETMVKKVLSDTLAEWARYAISEQRVLKYRLNIFGPEIVDGPPGGEREPMIAIQVLRSKIYKILQNIDALREIPASELVRSANGMSLAEVRLRLEEIVRYRLEPLAGRVATAGLIGDRSSTLRFLESQLTYDQRQLKSTHDAAETIRQSLAVYSLEQRNFTGDSGTAGPARESGKAPAPAPANAVTPQLSDSFIDRLVMLTSQSNDVQYRQKLVDDYRVAAGAEVPAALAVSYDQEILNLLRSAPSGGNPANAAAIQAEIIETTKQVKQLVGSMNDVYTTISRNLNPAKELYTLTAPAVSRTEHSRSLTRLALYGLALLALSLPIVIVLCLLHARVREEEATDLAAPEAAAAS